MNCLLRVAMWSRNMNKVLENIIFKILALTSLMQVKNVCLYSYICTLYQAVTIDFLIDMQKRIIG